MPGESRVMRGPDRRSAFWGALWHGARWPRRRLLRRAHEPRPLIDHHSAVLGLSAFTLLALCAVDAAFTLELLARGATEANPLMAPLVDGALGRFLWSKGGITALAVLLLVAVERYPLFRVLRAGWFVHAAAAGYLGLVSYELWLLGWMPA